MTTVMHARRRVRATLALLLLATIVCAAAAKQPSHNRFIVVCDDENDHPGAGNACRAAARAKGAAIVNDALPGHRAFAAEFPDTFSPAGVQQTADDLLKTQGNGVRFMEPDGVHWLIEDDLEEVIDADTPPSRSRKLLEQHRRNLAQTMPPGVPMADVDPSLWPVAAGGKKVCIIDSGYMLSHVDLPGTETTTGSANGGAGVWYEDTMGHGTHVAGTVAAVHNDQGVVGVAPSVGLHIVRVFDAQRWAYSSSLYRAIVECLTTGGAQIVSMSLGRSSYSSWEDAQFTRLAEEYDALFVAAAGNGGSSAYHWPASYPSVVSVGSVTASEVRSRFSQYNDRVELAAHGSSVLSTYKNGGYARKSGTSMATPHVSGVAALVWNRHPTCTSVEIRTALQMSARDKGPAGYDNEYGWGIVQGGAAIDLISACGCDVVECPGNSTPAPPTEAPPTEAPPTQAPPTEAPPTQPPTELVDVQFGATGPVAIPDARRAARSPAVNNLPAGYTSCSVASLTVAVDVTHANIGDVVLVLRHPTGGSVRLIRRRGGSGDNLVGTVFDDDAAVRIRDGSAPFTGAFRPENALARFVGLDATGRWRLIARDRSAGTTGTLDSWTVNITMECSRTDAQPTEAPPTEAPPTEAPPTQAPPTEAPPTQPPTELVDVQFGVTGPIAIPDNDRRGVRPEVVNNLPAGYTSCSVESLTVAVDVTHANIGDVLLNLRGPTGAWVRLINKRGGSGDNMVGTVFDDDASRSIRKGSAPFTGSYVPERGLARFDGLNAEGTWTLIAKDRRRGTTGTLDSWTVDMTMECS
ncbi:unnamed protein product [Pedinophyceae sp. YPF-701]|nr:unnamed protein product [Pedinophyceae sp. YPF-701]